MLYKETVKESTFNLLIQLMKDEHLHDFHLVGGTALALLINHRKSIDLDLFTQTPFDLQELRSHLENRYRFTTEKIREGMLFGFIDEVKIDLVLRSRNKPIKEIQLIDNIRIASIEDISAMKLAAISDNGTRLKDFIDIAYISTCMSLNEMIESFTAKYPDVSNMIPLRSLTYFEDIDFDVEVEMQRNSYRWDIIKERIIDMTNNPKKRYSNFPE